mgnify:CR=1 FL=1
MRKGGQRGKSEEKAREGARRATVGVLGSPPLKGCSLPCISVIVVIMVIVKARVSLRSQLLMCPRRYGLDCCSAPLTARQCHFTTETLLRCFSEVWPGHL